MRPPTGRRSLALKGSVAALAACAAVAVSACGGGSTTGGGGASADESLVVLEEDISAGLDYDGPSIPQRQTQTILANTMEGLLTYPSTADGDIIRPDYKVGADEFEPLLAEEWSNDGLEWTIKLRRGVISCAGNEFTADDVVYTIERAKSMTGATPIGWFMNNVAGILPMPDADATPEQRKLDGEVVKVDDYTVRFKQLHKNELFPRNLTLVGLLMFDSREVKRHATAEDPWSHDWVNTVNAPGFGPYCLKSWAKGSEMRLEANPKYYRGEPQFKDVVIRKVPANANRVAAIGSGSADIVTNLTPKEYARVAEMPGVKVLSWQNTRLLEFGMSENFAPWRGERGRLVRQAVAYALPYDEIIEQDYLDTARRWYGACGSTHYGYEPHDIYETDLDKASALLAEAGYADGKGLPADGLKLFYTAERSAVLEPIASRIRTSLAKVGIPITLAPVPQAEYADRRITKYDLPTFLEDQDVALLPDVGFCSLLFYVSKRNGGVNTPSAYDNPEFDALYAKSARTLGDERVELLRRMQEILMRDLPVIPIAEPASQLAVRDNLTGWQGTTFDVLKFYDFKTSR